MTPEAVRCRIVFSEILVIFQKPFVNVAARIFYSVNNVYKVRSVNVAAAAVADIEIIKLASAENRNFCVTKNKVFRVWLCRAASCLHGNKDKISKNVCFFGFVF